VSILLFAAPYDSNITPEYANAEAPQDQPPLTAKGWRSVIPDGVSYPVQQRIEAKRRGLGRQKYPFVCLCHLEVLVQGKVDTDDVACSLDLCWDHDQRSHI
jgi:hypothetical protein